MSDPSKKLTVILIVSW